LNINTLNGNEIGIYFLIIWSPDKTLMNVQTIPAWLLLLVSTFLVLSTAHVTLDTKEMEKQNALISTNALLTTATQMLFAVTRLALSTAIATLATLATEHFAITSTNASKKAFAKTLQHAQIQSVRSTALATLAFDFILRKSVSRMMMSLICAWKSWIVR